MKRALRFTVALAMLAVSCTQPLIPMDAGSDGGGSDASSDADLNGDTTRLSDVGTDASLPLDANEPVDANAPIDASDVDASDPPDAATTDAGVDAATAPDAGGCGVGQMDCGSGCIDTQSDPLHCGGCLVCPTVTDGMRTCVTGACDFVCNSGHHECGAACASDTSPMTCGALCTPCTLPANASSTTCDGTSCGFVCMSGFLPSGAACVPIPAPRPTMPLSLGDTTLRRPTLRWSLPAGVDGAVVELCSDRACGTVIETLRVTGSSVRPSADLPANSVVFWRLRGRVGAIEGTPVGPTWLFHVPGRNASSGVDTSFNPHLDLNADGFDDLAVGAGQASPSGRTMAGTVSVFLGSASSVPMLPTGVLEGVVALDEFGSSVACAGDVNGDGYADLAVGAYSASPGGRNRAGAVSIFYGGSSGVAATASLVIDGALAGDRFGISVSSAGDANGDGYADLVVGAYGAAPGGRAGAGAALVFHGAGSGLTTTAARVLEGTAAGDGLGAPVEGIGDVNGDGLGDIAVTSLSADPGGRTDAGIVSIHLGSPTGVVASAARVLEGVLDGDRFGRSVSSAGDVNADGFGDVIIGAFAADPSGVADAGTAGVYHGSVTGLPASPARLLPGIGGEFFAYSVAGAGDVNGDGFADVIVGALNSSPGGRLRAGTARVFHGSATGIAAAATRTLEGVTAGDELGSTVAGGRDLNRDGFSDVMAGTILASPGGRFRAGSLSVHLGSAAGTLMAPARVLEGAAAGDYFSAAVAWAVVRRAPPPRASTRRLRWLDAAIPSRG